MIEKLWFRNSKLVVAMIENLWFRILILVAAVVGGAFFSLCDGLVKWFDEDLEGRFAISIKLTLLGFPLFSTLWFLRNHDVQRRLAQGEENRRQGEENRRQGEENLRQSELFAAFGWLAGANVSERVLGLVELKRLRDLYPDFKERIDRATRTGVEVVKIETSPSGVETVKETAVLVGVDLSGMDLSNIVLRGANMDGVILEGTKLHGAKLKDAQMPNAKLKGTEFLNADCTGHANFTGAEVAGTKFIGTFLDGARLEDIKNMKNTDFTGAHIEGTSLQGSKLSGGIFHETSMSDKTVMDEDQIEYARAGGALGLEDR